MVAEMLAEEGVDVSYLVGGMKAWSEHLEPIKVADLRDDGELYQFVRQESLKKATEKAKQAKQLLEQKPKRSHC